MRSRRCLTSGLGLSSATVQASTRAGLSVVNSTMARTVSASRSGIGGSAVGVDRGEGLHAPPQHLGQQVVLGAEVVVGGGRRHPGPAGHAAHGEPGVADLLDLVLGGPHQLGDHLGLARRSARSAGGLEADRHRRGVTTCDRRLVSLMRWTIVWTAVQVQRYEMAPGPGHPGAAPVRRVPSSASTPGQPTAGTDRGTSSAERPTDRGSPPRLHADRRGHRTRRHRRRGRHQRPPRRAPAGGVRRAGPRPPSRTAETAEVAASPVRPGPPGRRGGGGRGQRRTGPRRAVRTRRRPGRRRTGHHLHRGQHHLGAVRPGHRRRGRQPSGSPCSTAGSPAVRPPPPAATWCAWWVAIRRSSSGLGPVFDAISSLAVTMGPFGTGLAAKLARNLVTYGSWLAAYEGQLLAEAAGIELAKLAEVVKASDVHIGGASRLMFRPTVAPFTEADDKGLVGAMQAGASLAHKDLAAALELADSLDVDLPLAAMTERPGRRHLRAGRRCPHDDDGRPGGRRGAHAHRRALRSARSGRTFEMVNPATEEAIGVVADAGPEDLDDAVAAARRAFDETGWSTDVALRVRGPAPAAGGLRCPRRRAPGHDRGRDGLAALLHLLGPARRAGGGSRLGGRSGRALPVGDRPGRRRAHGHPLAPLGPARGHRRGRGHHPVERPPPDQPGQAGPGPGRRQHRGAQAGPRHAVVRHRARPAHRRGDRHPGRGGQHRPVRRAHRRRPAVRRPPGRPDQLHRLDRHRQAR